jgi:hypothetical protein
MDEADYWTRLEYRVCDELAGMDDKALRGLWCDGFVAEQFLLDVEPARVVGYAWMGTAPRKQERWTFVLFLPHLARSREDLAWSSLLPPEGATEWLEIEREAKELRIHPTFVARA